MTPLHKVIINKNTKINPIWIMRQAGRYLPEFREIRKQNPDFITLCLNENLSTEITLQPLKRFNLDAAIIFSDILMLPYGLNQKVKFEKGFGPKLGEVNLEEMSKIDEVDFVEKVYPVYKAIKKVSTNSITKDKNTIGFVGAPWTLLVYIINQQSPKKKLKKAYQRNLVKRRIKESYRQNNKELKELISQKGLSCHLMYYYQSSEILLFKDLSPKILLLLQRLQKHIEAKFI